MKKYWMYFKDDGFSMGKKIASKPYQSLCESAQSYSLFYGVGEDRQHFTVLADCALLSMDSPPD